MSNEKERMTDGDVLKHLENAILSGGYDQKIKACKIWLKHYRKRKNK